jgi:hypothetical protein
LVISSPSFERGEDTGTPIFKASEYQTLRGMQFSI